MHERRFTACNYPVAKQKPVQTAFDEKRSRQTYSEPQIHTGKPSSNEGFVSPEEQAGKFLPISLKSANIQY